MPQGSLSLSDAQPEAPQQGAFKLADATPEEKPGAVRRFAEAYNPMPLIQRVFQPSGNHAEDLSGFTLGKNIVNLVTDLGMAQVEEGKKAVEAFQKGDHTETIARGLAALTPIFGPMSQAAADKWIAGDHAGAAGIMSSMIVPEVAHEVVPPAVKAVVKAAKAAPGVVADFATSEPIVKGLKRASEGAVIGSAMHGNVPGVVVGAGARAVAEKLGQVGDARRAATEVAAVPVDPMLDEIAKGQSGKPFAKLTPEAQATVKSIAERLKASQVQPGQAKLDLKEPVPSQAAVPGPIRPPLRPAVVPPAAEVQPAAVEVQAAKSFTPGPVTEGLVPPAETPKPAMSAEAQAAAEALGDLGTADLKPETPFPAPEHYQAKAQVDKARAVAEQLHKHGIPSEDMALLESDEPFWTQLFEGVGEHGPGKYSGDPKATVAQTLLHLRELEKAARKGAQEAPAGAILPVDESAGTAGGAAASEGTGDAVPGKSEAGGSTGQAADRQQTIVHVPGSDVRYPARYAVRELDDIQASHSGSTFQPNEKYTLENDRDYNQLENRGKVLNGSMPNKFEPAYHITDNPDATNGPVVIDQAGQALGGNGRTMILHRVYEGKGAAAANYRGLLERKAEQFGIDPNQVRGMKQPVLVREIADEHLADDAARQKAITEFNVGGTAALRASERAISDSRRVSVGTLDHIAAKLDEQGGNATLAKVLQGKDGTVVLNKLIDDGVISPQEKAAYATGDALTKEGHQRIARLLLGRFFRDPAQLDNIAPFVKNKLERIAAPLAQVETLGDWNLTPRIQQAMDLLEESQQRGIKNIDDVVKQSGLFGDQKYPAEAVKMAKLLQRGSAKDLMTAARQYSQDAQFASKGESLFGNAPTPEKAFADAFEKKAAPAAKPDVQSIADALGDLGTGSIGKAMKRTRKK